MVLDTFLMFYYFAEPVYLLKFNFNFIIRFASPHLTCFKIKTIYLQSYNSTESCGHYHMDKMQGRELTTDSIQSAFR